MAMERPRGALGKITIVFATKLKSFTFLPVLKKLPTEKRIKSACGEGPNKFSEALGDNGVAEGKPKDENAYKAEIVYISDTVTQASITKSAIAPLPTPTVAHDERGHTSPKPSPGTLDTMDNKHLRTSQTGCHNTGVEVCSVSGPQREEDVLSPESSVDLFASPFSSKDSILSEGWEQETGWSVLQMLSPSGSVSPCSSVRSGAFTPSVRRIKYHTLAPGSSLMHMPLTSCQTHVCSTHSISPCPLSTHARHRPPPAQLSLLTAILRKGRLPVLSSALQRPYSPCWPISPVNMSCIACSAASSVAPMVSIRTKSCVSKGTACIEPSCKSRLELPGIIRKTELESPKKHNKITAEETTADSARSMIFLGPEGKYSLTLSSYSTSEPPPGHVFPQTHNDIHEITDSHLLLGSSLSIPMDFSPEYNLDSQIQGNGHKSSETSLIERNANPFQTSSSDLKLVQMAHERSPAPDHVPNQESQDSEKTSPVPKDTDIRPGSHLRNHRKNFNEQEKIHSVSPVFPKYTGLTHISTTPSISPILHSPRPGSCTSTSDRYTLSSSPAIPYHHPSPTYSFCSSPSPSLTDSTPDIRGIKKPHKIKSIYKALAAIPTNTLLLEQQAIDDEVNKNKAPLDPNDSFAWEDPHSQMCSPAELRQQSTELYQVIDEVLKDTNRPVSSSPASRLTAKSATDTDTTRKLTPSPASLGRETKYAYFHLQPPAEKTMTKPGVIRPVMVMSDDDKKKSCFSNTCQRQEERFAADHQYKIANSMLSTKDGPHGTGDLERARDSSEVSVKCMSSSTLVTNRDREHSTPSPRCSSL